MPIISDLVEIDTIDNINPENPDYQSFVDAEVYVAMQIIGKGESLNPLEINNGLSTLNRVKALAIDFDTPVGMIFADLKDNLHRALAETTKKALSIVVNSFYRLPSDDELEYAYNTHINIRNFKTLFPGDLDTEISQAGKTIASSFIEE